jgi:TonB-linked SusC/RagA family outer membrane protein
MKKNYEWWALDGYALKKTFLGIIQSFAIETYAQKTKVELNFSQASLEQVLNEIEHQTEFYFLYNQDLINTERKVDIQAKGGKIDEVLVALFSGTDIHYTIIDRQIGLTNNLDQTNPVAQIAQQQVHKVTGKVTDASGNPLPGVTIVVKGTTTGVISDANGLYTFSNVPADGVLQFSFVGMKMQEIPIGNKTDINVALEDDSIGLEEVVAVGYGSQKKVNMTGAVSQVKMKEVLGDRPVISTATALQGTIPGLVVTGGSTPGQAKSFNIRGTTSLNGGSPLVLIDNVPGNLDMINPEDIESVSVLKDAASSAIYGARAAYGVILVSTKKGVKNQRFQLNYNNSYGFEQSINRPEQASALDFLKGYKNTGFLSGNYFAGQNIDKWIQYLTDYQKDPSKFNIVGDGIYIPTDNNPTQTRYYLNEKDLYANMLDKYGFLQSHNISVSGGTSNLSYRISLGYNDEQGPLLTNNDNYSRVTTTAYISADITPWLNESVDVRYANSTKSIPYEVSGSLYGMRICMLTPEGEMTSNSGRLLPMNTPKNMLLNSAPATTKTNNPRILSRTTLKPFKGMEAILEYTYNNQGSDFKQFNAPYEFTSIQLGEAFTANNVSQYWNTKSSTDYKAINAYATYTLDLEKVHHVKAMAGYNQESSRYEELNADRKYMINNDLPSFSSATGETKVTDQYSEYAVRGGFFRLNYDYNGKYLFEANGRYDGSSKFPTDTRFGFFPSVSLGWNLANENFMKWSSKWLNQFKLRTSWGQIGNQAISPYAYMPSMSSFLASWIQNGTQPTTLNSPGLVSSTFTWETVQTLDFGFDMSLFNSRLQTTFDWYQRDTKNMLAPGMELPPVVGATAPLQNVANLQTKGWEVNVAWHDKIGQVNYNIGFNLYDSQSHITKYDNVSGLLNSYYEGQEIGEIWGYVTDGFYSVDDFASTTTWKLKDGIPTVQGYNVKPGDVKFKNLNDGPNSTNQIDAGSSTLSDPGDRKVIGSSSARFQFGLNGGVTWKGLSLNIFLQGVGKRDYWTSDDRRWPFNSAEFGTIFADQLDYWMPVDAAAGNYVAVNPNAEYFRLYNQMENSGSNKRVQSRYLLDASYVRLKNISLSYVVPMKYVKKIGLAGVKIFTSIENPYTWTKLPNGYDPERLSWGYPFYRTSSFGLNISL